MVTFEHWGTGSGVFYIDGKDDATTVTEQATATTSMMVFFF